MDEANDDVDVDPPHERDPTTFWRLLARICLCGRGWTAVSRRMSVVDRFAFLASRSGALFALATGDPAVALAVAARRFAHYGADRRRRSADRLFADVAGDLVVATLFAVARLNRDVATVAAVWAACAASDDGFAFVACFAISALAQTETSRFAAAALSLAIAAAQIVATARLRDYGAVGDAALALAILRAFPVLV